MNKKPPKLKLNKMTIIQDMINSKMRCTQNWSLQKCKNPTEQISVY